MKPDHTNCGCVGCCPPSAYPPDCQCLGCGFKGFQDATSGYSRMLM